MLLISLKIPHSSSDMKPVTHITQSPPQKYLPYIRYLVGFDLNFGSKQILPQRNKFNIVLKIRVIDLRVKLSYKKIIAFLIE